MRVIVCLLVWAALICHSQALIGYDCGSRHTNVTSFSLIDVGECDVPAEQVTVTQQYIQLLQLNEYYETRVFQCKVEIRRTIYKCGMFSHVSIISGGTAEYIREIDQTACDDMHRTNTYRITWSHVVHNLRVNGSVTTSIVLAGKLDRDGGCEGEVFSDPYGLWGGVVVQGTAKITLTEYTARVSLKNNKVHLRSGVACTITDSHCIDLEGGYTFWKALPDDSCNFKSYSVLYAGLANKMTDTESNPVQTVYSLASGDITFALTARAKTNVCGYIILRTEHPKLLVYETNRGESFANNEKPSVSNLDIFAYVNSKFVYVERHIRSQLKQLYQDVIMQKCDVERQTLKNSLSIATQAPDEFAYTLMKGPGYMAVLSGEVVHVVKCIPVEVKIARDQECYAELKVTKENITFFMTPRTHILKSTGTRTTCNRVLPAQYYVGDRWYTVLPVSYQGSTPQVIKPNSAATWQYTNPADLATSGIYTDEDLNELRERIMFPVEWPALLNEVAREVSGNFGINQDGALSRLLNEHAVTKILESTWNQLWSRFTTFGTVSAGIIAIITLFQGIKLIVETVIRGYTLHTIFGWSMHLIGAIWGVITDLLIHRYEMRTRNTDVEAANVPEIPPPTATAPQPPTEQQVQPIYPQCPADQSNEYKTVFVAP